MATSPWSTALVLCDITSNLLTVAICIYPFFFLPNSNDVICFCPSFAILKVVKCSGAFKCSALSRGFKLTLEYMSKFASRDLLST